MRKFISSVMCLSLMLFVSTAVHAYSLSFSDNDFLNGASWGTMNIEVYNATTLSVTYTATSNVASTDLVNPIPSGTQATGFGFTFIPSTTVPNLISNAGDPNLNWVRLTNLSAIPQPANGDQFTPAVRKADFIYGATEGQSNGFSPPGILPGKSDTFHLIFTGVDFMTVGFKIEDFLEYAGVRLQGFELYDNDELVNSLYLVGAPDATIISTVPEPGTLILLGLGLAGLGFYRRKQK